LKGIEGSYAKEAVDGFVRNELAAQSKVQAALNLETYLKALAAYDATKQEELAREVLKQLQTQTDFDHGVAGAMKRLSTPAPLASAPSR